MAKMKMKGLGRGLGALLGESTTKPDATGALPTALSDGTRLLELDPNTLRPNPKQPRRLFNEDKLRELSASIEHDGVQEPVVVRQVEGGYEIIMGERRVRASIMAGLKKVPVICRTVSDRDMLKLGLIENIQREDLNAIELAQAYQELLNEYGWTQEALADEVGKNRATVANTLRLLGLPEVVQDMVADGSLSMGHARAILALGTPDAQTATARKIAREGLSVREAEKLCSRKEGKAKTTAKPEKNPNISDLENELRRSLGTRVSLKMQNKERGCIEIEYSSADELERILEVLRAKTTTRPNPLRP